MYVFVRACAYMEDGFFFRVSLCKSLHVCVYLFKFNLCVEVFLMHVFESASLSKFFCFCLCACFCFCV